MADRYQIAKEIYAEQGIDTEKVLEALKKISISLHCWQGDDVIGFESSEGSLSGGIQTTGNYPGKARTLEELHSDLEYVFSLLPGKHKVNVHALYLDNGGKFVDRDQIEPEHFKAWVDFAKKNGIGLDFNPSFFSHPKSEMGTLSNRDKGIRDFWIEHGKRSIKIAEYFGKELGQRCVTNFWMPDGSKDIPADKLLPRQLMKDSLDQIFAVSENLNYNRNALESKVFGIGLESYTVVSNEFANSYSMANPDVMVCMDAGHYHPTEVISDKISAVAVFQDEMLLHVSRPVRWDSDHVVILDDELRAIANEIIRSDLLNRVNIALDFFDASINRIAAWVIGVRATQKALLNALLTPSDKLKQAEAEGDYTSRLALMEEYKALPFGLVWDEFCRRENVPEADRWLGEVKKYEKEVLSNR